MSTRVIRRSGLTMPVNTARFVDRAWTRGCDFINLDLEDSVPEVQKDHARTLIKDAIVTVAKGGAEVFARINHDSLVKKSVQVELEQTYPRLGTIYSLCSVYYPNIR